MIIYKTTNLVNGKLYIGKDEKNNPEYLGSGKILKKAIKKHGIENFKKEILEYCANRVELNNREKHWIKYLDTIKNGYNISEGGTGGQTKFTKIYQYNKKGVFIKEWKSAAEIQRELFFDSSSILKVCKGKLHSTKGFIWSYEFHENIGEFKDSRTVEILQYSKKGDFIKLWESCIDVMTELKISNTQLYTVLDNTHLSAKNFIWIRRKEIIENKITINKNGYFNNKNAVKKY